MPTDNPTTALPARLRETFKAWGLRSLGDEAADEIELLRRRVEELEEQVHDAHIEGALDALREIDER